MVIPDQQHAFRDIKIICKGQFKAPDPEGLPGEPEQKVKAGEHGNFTITHIFHYSKNGGYREQQPPKVVIEVIKRKSA
jgi:hypothetical protein